jgi:hypothetical protein
MPARARPLILEPLARIGFPVIMFVEAGLAVKAKRAKEHCAEASALRDAPNGCAIFDLLAAFVTFHEAPVTVNGSS